MSDQPIYSLRLDDDDPDQPPIQARVYSFPRWAEEYEGSPTVRKQQMETLAAHGQVLRHRDGVWLDGQDLIVLRQRLAKVMRGDDHTNYWDGQQPSKAGPIRFLLDGLMPWGTCPSLAGQYGSGKTRLLVNLLRALVDPSVRFLGRFGPTTLTEEEVSRTIEYLNCETPAELFEEELRRAGMDRDHEGFWGVPGRPRSYAVRVRHLEQEGGADIFDITDPVIFDEWVFRLTYCEVCDGSPRDDFSPVMLIVDTMTAVLGDAGKESSDYAPFISAFHRLLRVCDIPNGLTVGHSYGTTSRLLNRQENMARQDGRWSYMSDDPENPTAARRFQVTPRSTAPRVLSTQVVEGEDGLLYLSESAKSAAQQPTMPTEEPPFTTWHLDTVRSRLASGPPEGLRKTEVTGTGREGKSMRAALNHLIEKGEVSVTLVSSVHMCRLVTGEPG